MSDIVYRAPREWTRVHPVSPYLGSGPIFAAVGFYLLYQASPRWLIGENESLDEVSRFPLWILAVAVVVTLGAITGFGVLAWSRNEYRIGDDAMYHRKGVVFKQSRQARLDRIQAVDVAQPLLARLFGLGQLDVEVAGGKGSGINLAYLRIGDCDALRNEILALAAGARSAPASDPQVRGASSPQARAASSPQAREASAPTLRDLRAGLERRDRAVTAVAAMPEREVYVVPTGRLLASVALSWPTLWITTGVAAAAIATLFFGFSLGNAIAAAVGTSLFAVATFLVGIGSYFWTQVNGGFGFTASVSQDGLRLRHGLLDTRRQTVPPGRVQAIAFRQPLLWRRHGWWRVSINVAGYQDDQKDVSTLLPVGTLDDALLALWLVLPDAAERDPAGPMARALLGFGAEDGFTPTPAAARVLDPWQWRRRGVLATDDALLIRSGYFTKVVHVVPNERTQSLGVRQGLVQRGRGLASLHVHSTPGPVSPVAEHLAVEDALALLDAQASKARERRRRQTTDQWAATVGIDE